MPTANHISMALLPKKRLHKTFLTLLLATNMVYAMSKAPTDPPIEENPNPPVMVSDVLTETVGIAFIDPQRIQTSQQSIATSGSHLALWQGMKHEWKRFIVDPKNGRIPHRISKLENYISQDGSNNQLTFHMGENTGVDGNYMYPESLASVVDVSGLSVVQGNVSLAWRDQLSDLDASVDGYVPQAKNRLRYTLNLPDLPWQEHRTSVFLQGIALETRCSDSVNDDTCNSDGMWPYLYHLAIDDCQASSTVSMVISATSQKGTQCQLNVNIYRAWTPNKGGFQLIGEVKPINHQLDFDLTVYYAGLSGREQDIAVSNVTTVTYEHELQDYDENPQNAVLISSGKQYQRATAAITGLGFALTAPDKINAGWKMLGSDIKQRGRYIARKQFELGAVNYSGNKFLQNVAVNMGLWAPTTVVESDVTTEMNLQLIELAAPVTDAANNAAKSVAGKICINSKDAAPFFSKWKKCDKQTTNAIKKFGGIERAATQISVELIE